MRYYIYTSNIHSKAITLHEFKDEIFLKIIIINSNIYAG